MDAPTAEELLLRQWSLVIHLFVFLVGLCVGSFLNVVIARVPEGLSVVSPPSRCPRCGRGIAWYDNIPVLSWVLLRGKCRGCALPISPRYPIVELLVGLLALALVRRFGLEWHTLSLFVFVCLLVAITYIDLDHWIIPHVLTWPGILIGLGSSFIDPTRTPTDALIGAVAGFGVFALVGIVGALVFRKEALGQGDWWLLALIGAFLGWQALLPVILLASLQGSVVGVLLIVLGRNETGEEPAAATEPRVEASSGGATTEPAPAKDESQPVDEDDEEWIPPRNAVPFGPFLALAALEQLFVGPWLLDLYNRLIERLIL